MMQTTSLWLAKTKGKNYPKITKDQHVDVLIVGAGIVGLTTAYYLSKSMQDMMIIEADEIGYGASGRNTGKLTFQHGLIYKQLWDQHGKEGAKAYYQAQQEAIESVTEIIKEHHIDCDLQIRDAMLFTQDEQRIAAFQEEYQTYLDLGIPCTFIKAQTAPIDLVAGIQVKNQASYDPYRYLLGLSDILDEASIPIYEHSALRHLVKDEQGYRAIIDDVCVHANKVVLATQFPIFDHRHFYFARLKPEVSNLVALDIETSISSMMMRDEMPLVSYNKLSLKNETWQLIGGYQHDCGKAEEEKTQAWLNHIMKQWNVDTIPYRWSSQDYLSLDHFPLIGPLDHERDDLFFASGLQKWGNTNGNVAGKLLCAYLLKQPSQYATYFDPHRSNSFLTPKFLQLNFHVMKELFSSHLSQFDHTYPQMGKASVLNIHGHAYGMYRDEHDEVYVVDITCPHLGCICSFNEADKTWDCPCHGSRFSCRGDIIKGPATCGLKAYGDGLNKIDPHLFK